MGRGFRPRGDRKIHAVDPDHYGEAPHRRTMCGLSLSRRYSTGDSSGPVNCADCKRAVDRATEASYLDSTCTGELFDWAALLLPHGRRPPPVLTEDEWARVFEARCRSKRGMATDEDRELCDRAYRANLERYSAMEPDVFNATVPAGSQARWGGKAK